MGKLKAKNLNFKKQNRIRELHSITYKSYQAYHNMSNKVIMILHFICIDECMNSKQLHNR